MATLPLYLQKRLHPEIIGKGGAVVKKLSADNNVSIKIPNKDDPSNVITVIGAPEAVNKTKAEIEQIVGFRVSTEPLVTVQIDVSPSYHGLIIGKGGATLKDLEQKSGGCSITIPKKEDANKNIILEGNKEAVAKAKALIEELIKSPVRIVDSTVAKLEELFKKLDLSGKPINESLFFPDPDQAKLPNFERFLTYLRSANKTLDICVFTITDDRISTIIEDCFRAGLKVRIITDDECMTQVGSDITRLHKLGIPIKTDHTKAHMHHKYAVIDNVLLVNGSFNWTRQASIENCENVMITNNKDFVTAFSTNFEAMWKDNKNFVFVK